MRTTRILALGLLLTAVAGCGGTDAGAQVASAGGATPTASSSAETTSDEDVPLKYAQCMREQGITWFPDPKPGEGMALRIPESQNKEKFDAAMEACKKYAPNGGDRGRVDPEQLEQARQMAKCMRENGVKDFPDPQPDGSVHIDGNKVGMGPGDPTFDKAEQLCAKYMPERQGGMTTRGPATA